MKILENYETKEVLLLKNEAFCKFQAPVASNSIKNKPGNGFLVKFDMLKGSIIHCLLRVF